MQKNVKKAKVTGSMLAIFGVASVLFSSHAGGGFATGNQETQYYVQYGWTAPLMAILAMIILTATMREVIIMYNNNNCRNYKDLFCELWKPYPKLEIIWEIYYYLMVLIAVSAVIAGAAAVFQSIGVNYFVAVFIIGVVLLVFTIFGAMLDLKQLQQ
ncbi:solute symporter family protein [Clostridioides difficile CD22]|nr:solute symporter family protein [Clostridioides difficile]EQE32124.1 solute symporter family protein [Clostridioides difficile CD22]